MRGRTGGPTQTGNRRSIARVLGVREREAEWRRVKLLMGGGGGWPHVVRSLSSRLCALYIDPTSAVENLTENISETNMLYQQERKILGTL